MVDVKSIESIISKIPGVKAARTITEDDKIVEIHVVANDEKTPKQIVRDIETVLFASLGIKIDRKIISIAQLDSQIETSKIVPYKLENIEVSDKGRNIEVSVEIVHGNEKYSGSFSGPKTKKNVPIVIGNAILNALESVHDFAISIDDVAEIMLAGKTFIVSHLSKEYNSIEESIIGASEIKNDNRYKAIAESVLDAFRRI